MAKITGTLDTNLRRLLKQEHGPGWGISEQSGNTKLTRRHADGTRSSVMLELPWTASSTTKISAAVARLRQLMEERNLALAEAHKLTTAPAASSEASGAINWPAVAEAFLATRSDRRATTLRDLKGRVRNALLTLETKPRPRDGRSLMRAYAAQHFAKCPSGGQGRKRHLGDVSAFLTYAVDRAGAEACWRPLEGEELEELIATADNGAGEELTPPIKPEQLAALLDALEADNKPELRLAVALVGLFGLRPAELAALRVEDGRLKVGGGVKRNRRTMKQAKPDRLVLPLDIPGREGEGARVLQLYASGMVKLPKPLLTAIAGGEFKPVGDAFRQLLERYPFWQSLAKATPGLTPYSLRHGYAWRGHKAYARSLSVRDLAALMGHNPATHHKHYGKWTDEDGLLEAVASLGAGSTPPLVAAAP
jgi:integrase